MKFKKLKKGTLALIFYMIICLTFSIIFQNPLIPIVGLTILLTFLPILLLCDPSLSPTSNENQK